MSSEQYLIKYRLLAVLKVVWMYTTAHTTQHKRCNASKPFRSSLVAQSSPRPPTHNPASLPTRDRRLRSTILSYSRVWWLYGTPKHMLWMDPVAFSTKNAKYAGEIKEIVGRTVLDLHIYVPTVSPFTMSLEQYLVKCRHLAVVQAVWMYDTAQTTQHKRCFASKPFRFIHHSQSSPRLPAHNPASLLTRDRRLRSTILSDFRVWWLYRTAKCMLWVDPVAFSTQNDKHTILFQSLRRLCN